jgi:hypothetical protein
LEFPLPANAISRIETALKTQLATDLLALTVEERAQISGNRAWRDLVETKFGFPATQTDEIKDILKIPR